MEHWTKGKPDTGDMDEEDGCVVRIRGLPWSASQDEVAAFLEDCNVVDGKNGIHFTYVRDGRPSGEAYVEMASEDDLEKALSKNKQHMGKRYIEVFRSKKSEMDWVVRRSGPNQPDNEDAVIRLRGLPYGCSKEEIAHFFSGLEIVPNGITLLHDHQGRTTGDAYVQFAGHTISEEAVAKHKEKIGHRYIEIFKSSLQELRNASQNRGRMMMSAGMSRPGPYDRMMERFGGGGGGSMGGGGGMGGGMGMGGGYSGRGRGGRGNIKGIFDDGYDDFSGMGGMGNRRGGMGNRGGGGGGGMGMGGGRGMGGNSSAQSRSMYDSQTGHSVHMRGLPFAANEQDILDFFKPLNPVNVVVHYNNDGRASGESDVDFATHEEAQQALTKDRAVMRHRYIELFLRSTPAGRSDSGNGDSTNFGNNMGAGNNQNFGNDNFGGGGNFNNMNQGYNQGGGDFNNGMSQNVPSYSTGIATYNSSNRNSSGTGLQNGADMSAVNPLQTQSFNNGSGYGNNMGNMGSGYGNNMGNMGGGNMGGNPNYTAF